MIYFAGELIEDNDNPLLLVYKLGTRYGLERNIASAATNDPTRTQIDFVSSEVESSALVALDKPLRIVSLGNREYTLTISKVDPKK